MVAADRFTETTLSTNYISGKIDKTYAETFFISLQQNQVSYNDNSPFLISTCHRSVFLKIAAAIV